MEVITPFSGAAVRALRMLAVSIVVVTAALAFSMLRADSASATLGVAPSITINGQTPLPANVISGRKWFASNTITFSITVNANAEPGPITIECRLDDGVTDTCPVLTPTSPNTYNFTYSSLADGAHDITISATDGDVPADSAEITALLGVDTGNPLIGFNRPVGPTIRTTLSAFKSEFSVFDGFTGSAAAVECRVDAAAYGPCDQIYFHELYGLYEYQLSGLTVGTHTFDVRATDTVNRVTVGTLTIHMHPPGQGIEVSTDSSTTFSAAHPDLRIQVDNHTDKDLTSFAFKLPDGLFGSLAGVPGAPGDSATRCPFPTSPDFFIQCDADIKAATRVGTIQSVVRIGDHDVKLDGSVHLVDPFLPGEPAALAYAINAKLGELDFGTIVVGARVIIMPTELEPMVYEDTIRSPTGLNTIVDDIPTTLEDPEHGTIDFTIKSLTIDILGEVPGGPQPFLTNPSSCEPGASLASVVTNDGETYLSQPEYTATGCDGVAFAPTIDQFELTSYNKDDLVGLTVNVHLPDEHSTIEAVRVDLPRSLVTNNLAYGVMCQPEQAMRLDPEDELNGGCPDSTRIGTATINTPLLTAPITGNVYLESSGGTLPYLYINVRDSSLGVNARLRASNDIVSGGPNGHIRTTLDVFSDSGPRPIVSVPVTDFTLNLVGTHQGPGDPPALTPMFKVGGACNPTDFAFARFSSHARPGLDLHEAISPPITFNGCTDNTQIDAHESLFTPPSGGTTSNTSAAFRLNWTGAGSVTFSCSLDGANYVASNCGAGGAGGTTVVKQYTGLADGVHKLVVSAGSPSDADVYTWKVDTSTARDTTPPSAPALTSGPTDGSTSSDSTPTWQFTSGDGGGTPAGSLKFQCRVSDQAFTGCGSGSPGQFTAPELASAASQFDGQHSFSVRAQDQFGNVSAITSVSFGVGSPLAAVFTGQASTYVADENPAISLTLGNDSSQDIRDVTLSLPDDMTVNPDSAAQVCTFVAAMAASCPAGSQIADAEATVQVDRTRLTLPGAVYLVEAASVAGLNRLAVVIDPTLGAIDFGSKIVAIGNTLPRVSPAGIDFQFTSLPVTALDVPKSASMTFRLRSLKLDFSASPDGIDPQFTNPLVCGSRSFDVSVTTYTDNTVTGSDPFAVTGCSQPSPTVQITAPAPSSVTNDNTPTLTFTVSDPAAACTRNIDATGPVPVTSGTALPALADGTHQVVVNCANVAGGGSDDSQFNVDTTAPTVVIAAPVAGSSITDSAPTLDYSVSDAGDSSPSCNVADGSSLGPYAAGAHSVTVTCTDDAGNSGSSTSSFTVVTAGTAGFVPALAANLSGRAGAALAAGSAAALSINLTTAPGNEGVTGFALNLPAILRIDVLTLPNAICEVSQANAGACPEAARVGTASGQSPSAGALAGGVYLLRSAGASVPDLAVLFGGQSNWLRGTRSATTDGRLGFSFAGAPATLPLTGVSLSIDGLFSLTRNACGPVDLSMPATVDSESAKTATLNPQVSVQGGGLPAACTVKTTVKSTFKNKLKRSTLAITVTSDTAKIKSLSIKLPGGLKQVKKALGRKLVVKADGRRLKPKCFKFSSAVKLDVGLCGEPASKIELSFKAGALIAAKKVKPKATMTIVVTPQSGTAQTLKSALAAR